MATSASLNRRWRRPEWLFLNRFGEYVGELPETTMLTYELPPGFRPEDRGQVVYVAEMGVHLAEEFARRKNARKGIKYLGRARSWNADTNLRGTKKEPHGHGSGPDPVMASDRETKYLAELEHQAYLDAYSEALGAWQQGAAPASQHGEHAVIFPFGTWKVVRHHAAVLGLPPPDFRR